MAYEVSEKSLDMFLKKITAHVLPADERLMLKKKRRQIKSMQSHFK